MPHKARVMKPSRRSPLPARDERDVPIESSSWPFVVEKLDEEKRRWRARTSRPTLEEAEACAWALLTRRGGEYRVQWRGRVLARGAGYANRESPTERTAIWGRTALQN